MRKAVYALLGVLFVCVAAFSTVRLDPVVAQCAPSNNLVASDGGAETNPSGHWDYTLTVESWDLTFTPIGLILDLHPFGGTTNVTDVEFTPDMVSASGYGCINDTEVNIAVDGELEEDDESGSVNARITLSSGPPNTYSEPWATFIPST